MPPCATGNESWSARRVPEAFVVSDIEWLDVSMYKPEHCLQSGVITDPEPYVTLPEPPRLQLYNIDADPLEQADLADDHPEIVHCMNIALENGFDEVEAERRTIADRW